MTKAGLVTCAPVSGCHWGMFYQAEGAPPRGPNDPNPVVLNRVASPGYFEAMGIRLKEGRFFTAQDGREGHDQGRRHHRQRDLREDVLARRREPDRQARSQRREGAVDDGGRRRRRREALRPRAADASGRLPAAATRSARRR